VCSEEGMTKKGCQLAAAGKYVKDYTSSQKGMPLRAVGGRFLEVK
jgi:hypothetical protein